VDLLRAKIKLLIVAGICIARYYSMTALAIFFQNKIIAKFNNFIKIFPDRASSQLMVTAARGM